MKYFSIIALISAAVHFAIGISICRNKLKGFVNITCKKPKRYKILGGHFIAIGVIMPSRFMARYSFSISAGASMVRFMGFDMWNPQYTHELVHELVR